MSKMTPPKVRHLTEWLSWFKKDKDNRKPVNKLVESRGSKR